MINILQTRTRFAPCTKFGIDPLRIGARYQRDHNQALQADSIFSNIPSTAFSTAPKTHRLFCPVPTTTCPIFHAKQHSGSTRLALPTGAQTIFLTCVSALRRDMDTRMLHVHRPPGTRLFPHRTTPALPLVASHHTKALRTRMDANILPTHRPPLIRISHLRTFAAPMPAPAPHPANQTTAPQG